MWLLYVKLEGAIRRSPGNSLLSAIAQRILRAIELTIVNVLEFF